MITELKENQVFVFGSNMNGAHGGGAARTAHEKFGAVWGIWNGITGQSYAIPTLGKKLEKLPLSLIQSYLNELTEYAIENPNKEFLLTPIGTGIAGFSFAEINSILPELPPNVIKVGDWQ